MTSLGREKENEKSVRERLQEEVKKARRHLENIMEMVVDSGNIDTKVTENVKRVLDELSVFDTDVDLSETGHKYPLMSPQHSIKGGDVAKIREYEREFIEAMDNVTKTAETIERKVINGEDFDINRELLMVRQYITKARNSYNDRIEYIKGIKG